MIQSLYLQIVLDTCTEDFIQFLSFSVRLLCQCGLDVSAKDYDGWTPLHAAAHWGQSEACRLLAEQLCDMEAHSNGVSEREKIY